MASLGRRLQSLESRITPDRPKLIFIMPYVDSSEPVSGLSATFLGKIYTFDGSNLDALVKDAECVLKRFMTSQCEVVSVTVLH